MSTKSTIILSKDNEHWYSDCASPRYQNGKHMGDDITIEIDKSNIVEHDQDSDTFFIVIRGDSDLAQKLHRLKYNQAIEIK